MYRIVFINLFILIFGSRAIETDKTGNFEILSKSSPTAEQTAEINAIRNSLNNQNVQSIHSTREELQEIDEISRQINQAIQQHSFANGKNDEAVARYNEGTKQHKHKDFHVGGGTNEHVGIKLLEHDGTNKTESRADILDRMVEETIRQQNKTLNAVGIDEQDKENDTISDAFLTDDILPNLVDSKIESDIMGQPSSHPTKYLNRENLKLVSITEDLYFEYGENVRAWRSLENNAKGQHGLIGITETEILLIQEKDSNYTLNYSLNFGKTISHCDVFMHFNHSTNTIEDAVVIGMDGEIVFVSVSNDKLSIIWKWAIHISLTTLTYFKIKDQDHIALINNITSSSESSLTSADIYQFNLNTKKAWLFQKIPLNYPCSNVQYIDTGRDFVLCFLQNSTVDLYKSDTLNVQNIKFEYFMNISSENVNTISTFSMGGYSYLALGGLEPQILRYHRGQFYSQTILSKHWGYVEEIIPIPARTYRDDLILLIQHKIVFDGHSVSVLEALIWTGEAFDQSFSVPCIVDDVVVELGMTCMLDLDRDEGLVGIAIIQHDNNLSLLIPRYEAPSALFRIEFELVQNVFKVKSEHIDYNDLIADVDRQHKIINQAEKLLEDTIKYDGSPNYVIGTWTFNSLDINQIQTDAQWKVEDIYFGGHKWTDDDLTIDVPFLLSILEDYQNQLNEIESEHSQILNAKSTEDVESTKVFIDSLPLANNGKFDLENIQIIKSEPSKRNANDFATSMQIDQLTADNLNVEFINDVAVSDFLLIGNDNSLKLNKLVIEDLESETINLKYPEQLVGDEMSQDQVKNNLHITGDLMVDEINGLEWSHFIDDIVMTNLPNRIPNIDVKGIVTFEDAIFISRLNNLSYPQEFIWNFASDLSIITGLKTFVNNLTTEAIDTSGTIDGIDTFNVVTLTGRQHIGGNTTFTQLEVTEVLNVNGTISGQHLDEFLANPNLLQTNLIKSNCLFYNLQVEGPISIETQINGTNIDDVLSDVIYKNVPRSMCTSFKSFKTLETSDLQLTSSLLNNIEIGNYLVSDLNQSIRIDKFIGNIFFHQLYTDGLFNFLNATELDHNAIKLFGEQFTSSELTFENDFGDQKIINFDLDVNNLEITSSVNELKLDDVVLIDRDIEFTENVVITNVIVENLQVNGQIFGNTMLNGESLEQFEEKRLSRSKVQEITGSYHIKNALIKGNIEAVSVNDYAIESLIVHSNNFKNISNYITNEQNNFVKLIVDGNIEVKTINGRDFDQIRDNAIWLNRPNQISGNLHFLDEIIVNGPLNVDRLNDQLFTEFATGLVLRNDGNIHFTGTKTFANQIHIQGNIETNQINGILTDNIFTKTYAADISSKVHIIGDVLVEKMIIRGMINGFVVNSISNAYTYDPLRQAHVIHKSVNFNNFMLIETLQINKGINAVTNVTSHLDQIIRKDQSGTISGVKRFRNLTFFENNLNIMNFNELDVSRFLDNIILNERDKKIAVPGNIAFTDKVTVKEIHVTNDIMAKEIMNCNLNEWHTNALRIDQNINVPGKLLFGMGLFVAANVLPIYLNSNLVSDMITLHTEQSFFDGTVYFSDVFANTKITVGGLVNGFDLATERENTVMIDRDNYITTPTILYAARCLSSLQTISTVNDKNIKLVVPLNENMSIQGPISFRSLTLRNLYTKDQISGFDFNYWYDYTLWKTGKSQQTITGNWTIQNTIIDSNIYENGQINGIDVRTIEDRLNYHKDNIDKNLQTFGYEYKEACQRIKELIVKSKKSVYFLSHFESAFSIYEKTIINSIYMVDVNYRRFLLVNVGCITNVYVRIDNLYKRFGTIETGYVYSWVHTVDYANQINVVTNSQQIQSKCKYSGINVWKFDGYTFSYFAKINISDELVTSLHISKKKIGRFYALESKSVSEYDLNSNLTDKWHIPSDDDDDTEYRFLPDSTNLGLALFNGKVLWRLSPNRRRFVRGINETIEYDENDYVDEEVLENNKNQKKRFFCKEMHNSIKNSTEKCKLRHEARLAKMPLLLNGPFKNLTILNGTLLSNFLNKTWEMGKNISLTSPIKLKIFPSESQSKISNNKINPFDWKTNLINADIKSKTTKNSEPKNLSSSGPLKNREVIDRIEEDITVVDEIDDKVDDIDEKITVLEDSDELGKSFITEKPTNRDAFGDIDEKTVKIVDNIADTIVHIDNELSGNEDNGLEIDLGNAATTESPPINRVDNISDTINVIDNKLSGNVDTKLPNLENAVNTESPPTNRDAFGDIDENNVNIVDDIADTIVDIDNELSGNEDNGLEIDLGNAATTESQPTNRMDNISDKIIDINNTLSGNEDTGLDVKLGNTAISPTNRDAFGDIDEETVKNVDVIADSNVNIDNELSGNEDNELEIDLGNSANTESPPINRVDNIFDTKIDIDNKISGYEDNGVDIDLGNAATTQLPPTNRDAFGDIDEEAVTIVDNIADAIVDIDNELSGNEDNGLEIDLGNAATTGSPQTNRDAFGDIDEEAVNIVDNIADTIVHIDNELSGNEDNGLEIDLGNAATTESSPTNRADNISDTIIDIDNKLSGNVDTKLPNLESAENTESPPTNRDAFGDIDEKTVNIVDDIADAIVVIDNELSGNEDNGLDIDLGDALTTELPTNRANNNLASNNGNDLGQTINFTNSSNFLNEQKFSTFYNIDSKELNKNTQSNVTFNNTNEEVAGVLDTVKTIVKNIYEKITHHSDKQENHNNNHHIVKVEEEIKEIEIGNSKNEILDDLPTIPKVSLDNRLEFSSNNLSSTKNTDFDFNSTISTEIPTVGVSAMENSFLPSERDEEVIAVTVGEMRKTLIAVSSLKDHVIKGKHNTIRIYEDIIEGNLFQTLICHQPRSLTVLYIRDETVLAFIENDVDIQIYIYRGIQGFVKFTSFRLPTYVSSIAGVSLASSHRFACDQQYLVVVMKKEIRFFEAITNGYCGFDEDINCN